MKRIFSTLFLFISAVVVHAQHETDERVIGFKYILTFQNKEPVVQIKNQDFFNRDNANNMGVSKTSYANSICDTLGNLLFYYDGFMVYNANGQRMNNGNLNTYNFNLYYCSTLIVPVEESNRRYYYLFETVPHIENWDFQNNQPQNCPVNDFCFTFQDVCKLQYHIIDMHANGGHGSVIKKNIFVADSVAPSISGIKHQNNIDTWVSVLKSRTNIILNYNVNSCGIIDSIKNSIPDFEYPDNPYWSYLPSYYGLGFQLTYSTAGDLVTFTGTKKSENTQNTSSKTLFIAPFDNSSGLFNFSLMQTIPVRSDQCSNLFSHNSKYLYYSDTELFAPVWIYQYDVATKTSKPFLYNLEKNRYTGTDYGKNNDLLIYKYKVTPGKNNDIIRFEGYLGKLKNIDESFVTSNLVDSLHLPSYNEPVPTPQFSYTARNNYIYNFYHPDYKKPAAFPVAHSVSNTVTSPSCFNAPVMLKGNTNIPVDSLYWLVKKSTDNTWQRFDADTVDLPLGPGTYTASLVSYKYCLADTSTQQFTLQDYPAVHLADDTMYTCEKKPIELPVNDTYSYTWYNAQGGRASDQVTETGQYNIVVQNSCGTQKDSLYLKNSTLDLTNLVTPNSDNQNDCMIVTSDNLNETISISIYNSWGSRIFYDTHYTNNWCPENNVSDGLYYYEARYNNNCSKKGWVEIIR